MECYQIIVHTVCITTFSRAWIDPGYASQKFNNVLCKCETSKIDGEDMDTISIKNQMTYLFGI